MQPRVRALLTMDLDHVNQSLALKGEAPVDAILGADVLEAQAAVIDYGSLSIFLRVQRHGHERRSAGGDAANIARQANA